MTDEIQSSIDSLRKNPLSVLSGQTFSMDSFKPGDEYGIARLFYAVYGDQYPVTDYYIPERILQLCHEQRICPALCRTSDGNIVAYGAFYRSSPPYPRLYEVGQYIVLPNYRSLGISSLINSYLYESVLPLIQADGIFGEAVTNHTITQRFDKNVNMTDYALELSLFPPGKGRDGAVGRVSCLFQFIIVHDREHTVHVPAHYRNEIEFLVGDADFRRHFCLSSSPLPKDILTRYQDSIFPGTGTARFVFHECGADFVSVADRLEEHALRKGCVTFQAFFNLADAGVVESVEILRRRGWFMGGYLPRWFDSDGWLMQKVLEPPDFDAMKLHTPKAKEIQKRVRKAYEASSCFC